MIMPLYSGWYLMVPPPLLHGNPPVDLEAPLSNWRLFSMHESAAEPMTTVKPRLLY